MVVVKIHLLSCWLPHGEGFFSAFFMMVSLLFLLPLEAGLALMMFVPLADCSMNRTSKVIYFTMIVLLFWELNEYSMMAYSVCHLSFMQ